MQSPLVLSKHGRSFFVRCMHVFCGGLQMLQVAAEASPDTVDLMCESKLRTPPNKGYSMVALAARAQVLEAARDTLLDETLRQSYLSDLKDSRRQDPGLDAVPVDVPLTQASAGCSPFFQRGSVHPLGADMLWPSSWHFSSHKRGGPSASPAVWCLVLLSLRRRQESFACCKRQGAEQGPWRRLGWPFLPDGMRGTSQADGTWHWPQHLRTLTSPGTPSLPTLQLCARAASS